MAEETIIQTAKFLNKVVEILFPYVLLLKNIVVQFWWVVLPFFLYKYFFRFIFVLFMETKWNKSFKRVVLEVKVPQYVNRPLKAMEDFFSAIWPIYDPPKDWRTTFFEGKTMPSVSFEIVGIDGEPHFFIRIPETVRKLVESALYSQYPEIEIVEVPDYAKSVPKNIPNKDWEMWGCDFMPIKSDVYPLKTYPEFFEENPDGKKERMVDPLSSLLETISTMKKGEHLWIQIVAAPISVAEDNYVKRGKEVIDKLLKRTKAKSSYEPYPMFLDALRILILGEPFKENESKSEEGFPMEMRMTPGEKEIIAAIERKISKVCYQSFIRCIYLGKRKVFFGGAKAYGPSFFTQFTTQHLNGLKPWSKTITKIQSPDIFTKRRLYVKKRNMFENYINRRPAFDPFPGGTFLLGVDELATIYHFPTIEAVPTQALKRIQTKRGAPPATLPVED